MLTLYSEFAGVGGDTLGASRVPHVRPMLAVNHWQVAVDSHAANFPDADHECCDARALDMATMPRADIFWASPACPPWTDARGMKRDFDKQTVQQGVLFGETAPDETTRRARALIEEIPRYLAAMARRGKPVLVGVVENVIQCRLWADWDRWIREIELLGYHTRLIAFNSMHAIAPRSRRAPQSRDRLYLAYWHTSLGRTPDWNKWLRPAAWCPTCQENIPAMQVFKKPRADMGRYRSQYLYRCPRTTCRHRPVEPAVLPALVAIDPTIPGIAIKDRADNDPLAPATIDRIKAGIRRYWLPLLTPAGGTWRDQAIPLHLPMPARTTTESDGVAVPPLLVPVEGRPGKVAAPATAPQRTQTARNETALAQLPLPFLTPLRGGGDAGRARPVIALATVCAAGNHHGLALPPPIMGNITGGEVTAVVDEPVGTITAAGHQSLITWAQQLLVPYYDTDVAIPATGPVGALTARDATAWPNPATPTWTWTTPTWTSSSATCCSACSNPTRSPPRWPSTPTTRSSPGPNATRSASTATPSPHLSRRSSSARSSRPSPASRSSCPGCLNPPPLLPVLVHRQ